ncbi:Hypothetical predicted protein, partial [Paramuricea clavata]
MGSEDEDSSTAVNQSDSKTYPKKRNSKKRSAKDKSKKYSPRNIPEEVKEEPVTKTDINDNMIMASADFTDDIMEEQYPADLETNLPNEFLQSNEDTHDSTTHSIVHPTQRNFNNPSQFEREQFNETNLDNYSEGRSPSLYSKRDEIPLGASASDLASHLPDVPPIGERKTPIGKGISTESIHSYKEKWHTLAQSATNRELITESHDQEGQKQKHSKKQSKQKHVEEEQQLVQQQQQQKQQHLPAQQRQKRQKQFSQSAQLVRQQVEVANKLRALSVQGSYAFGNADLRDGNISRENTFVSETPADSQGNRQENQRITPSETDNPEVKSKDGRITNHVISDAHSRHSERYEENKGPKKRSRKSNRKNEIPASVQDNQGVDNSQTSTLQQMSTTMAKEACRKLYLQVKTLDREKSALETLSQSLNEENTTLKKLNESLTKNVDTSSSGTSIGLLQIQIEELRQENSFLKDS